MHYSQALVALAALSSTVAARPNGADFHLAQLKNKFSVEQVARKGGNPHKHNGPAQHAKALKKFGAKVPTQILAAAAAQQTGSVVATPEANDEAYDCPVAIGSTGQVLNLDFDTGSSDLWVFSSETAGGASGHNAYDPSKSTSAKKLDDTWKISYGDGSGASGDVYADTVVIGGVTATSQAVEAATSVSTEFAQRGGSDGLVGLAFSSINTVTPDKQTTFWDTVSSSLPSNLFTATLKHGKPGSYDFGYIDQTKYTGDITYTPVDNSQGFWAFTPDSFSTGSSSTMLSIADTGTTLILLADDAVSAYYKQINGAQQSSSAGGWVFPCSTTAPDFGVVVGGTTINVPGQYINFAENGDGTCYGGIQSAGNIGLNILGDVFLKNLYVVFDAGNTRLGFATQAGGISNGTASAHIHKYNGGYSWGPRGWAYYGN